MVPEGAWLLCQVVSFQVLHGLDKGAFYRGHDHLDGVEVFPALKTSGQVGFGVNGGMQPGAARAAEPQSFAATVHFHFQPMHNQVADGDLVAQGAQKGRWVVASHQGYCPEGEDLAQDDRK
jgi:hypothetical protein